MALIQQDFNPQPDTGLNPSPATSESAERQNDIQEEVSGSEITNYEPQRC